MPLFPVTALYLVTGFLGAGKTTFLKNLIRAFAGQQLYLIINEFGKVGVDGALLRTLDAELAEVNNGSIFCACRLDQFEAVLKTVEEKAPDVVLVESSGLSDPTYVRRVLAGFPGIQYRGSICVADAQRLHRVFSTAVVCRRQLMASSLVLLNKCDLVTAEQLAAARALVLEGNPAAHIRETRFGAFDPKWLLELTPDVELEEGTVSRDITLQKALVTVAPGADRERLENWLCLLSENTYRMKGFVMLADGKYLVDCTGADVRLTPWAGDTDNRIVLLAGRGMPLRRALKDSTRLFGGLVSDLEF